MADTSFDDSLLVAMSLPSKQTLSPGVNTGAGSGQWL
jgi:hypothetical protein